MHHTDLLSLDTNGTRYLPGESVSSDTGTLQKKCVGAACDRCVGVFAPIYLSIGLRRDPTFMDDVTSSVWCHQGGVLDQTTSVDSGANAVMYVSNTIKSQLLGAVDTSYSRDKLRDAVVSSIEDAQMMLRHQTDLDLEPVDVSTIDAVERSIVEPIGLQSG
jgi:hypothetical protein